MLEITRHLDLKTGPTGGLRMHQTRKMLVQALRDRDPLSTKLAQLKYLDLAQLRLLPGTFG